MGAQLARIWRIGRKTRDYRRYTQTRKCSFGIDAISESEAAVITHIEDQQAQEESGALAVSVDDFAALEERVRRAVDVVKRERHARIAAEARAMELESRAIQADARQADIEARAVQAEAQKQSQSTEHEKLQSEL